MYEGSGVDMVALLVVSSLLWMTLGILLMSFFSIAAVLALVAGIGLTIVTCVVYDRLD